MGLLTVPRDPQEFSPATKFESIHSSVLSLLYGPILTYMHDYWKDKMTIIVSHLLPQTPSHHSHLRAEMQMLVDIESLAQHQAIGWVGKGWEGRVQMWGFASTSLTVFTAAEKNTLPG